MVRQYSTLELADVYGALAYFLQHRDQVEEYLQRRGEQATEVRDKLQEAAGLFGSRARGEASPDSDVDVLVRFDERRSLIDQARVEREIGEAMGRSVDLVTENALSPHLRDQVEADLEVLVDDEG
ncbi:MAG: hypothetical protein BRD32_04840 [Bacteroidetes bacterium QH_2_64_74]|nr:MAG: hypothetical protein BRD32_04840 [Bacteroidetes bacterium QH_2_64_74]